MLNEPCVSGHVAFFVDIVCAAIGAFYKTLFGNLTNQSTVCTEFKYILLHNKCSRSESISTDCNITVMVEIVSLTVNFYKSFIVGICRTMISVAVIVTGTFFCGVPSTLGHTLFIKLIGYAVYSVFTAYSNLRVVLKEVPVTGKLLPATCKLTNQGVTPSRYRFIIEQACVLNLTFANTFFAKVIIVSVNKLNACKLLAVLPIAVINPAFGYNAVYIVSAIGPYTGISQFTRALKHSIDKFKIVSCCGNGGAPNNGRITNFTPSSACITVFRTSCIKVFNRNCVMYVVAVRIVEALIVVTNSQTVSVRHAKCVYIRTGESMACVIKIGNNAHLSINVYRKRRSANVVALPCFNCICVSVVIALYIIPYTNGKACYNYCTGFGKVVIIAGKLDCQNILCLVSSGCKFILTVKTVKSFNLLKFPIVHAVKVKSHLYCLNSFYCINLYVNPINRTVKYIVKSTVLRLYTNRSFAFRGFNFNLTLGFGIVSNLIADTHTYGMNTVGQNCIVNGNHSIGKFAINLNTVDICNCGRCINTAGVIGICNVFSNKACKANNVFFYGLTVQIRSIAHAFNCISHTGEYRAFTVINCIGIVYGNIINVEGEITCIIGFIILPRINVYGIKLNKAICFKFELRTVVIVAYLVSVIFKIYFAVLYRHFKVGPTGILSVIDVFFVIYFHAGAGFTCKLSFFIVQRNAHINRKLYCIFRHINPETNAGSVLYLNRVTGPHKRVACPEFCAVQSLIHRIMESKRLITAMNLTGFFCYDRKVRNIKSAVVACSPIAEISTDIAFFKVEQRFRTFTKVYLNCVGNNRTCAVYRYGNNCTCTGLSSGEFVAGNSTNALIRNCECYVIILDCYVIKTVLCNNFKLCCGTERNSNQIARERYIIGKNNVNFSRANNNAVNC